jgi:hypothetical protein
MNPAPAELLQLLKSAALQLSSSPTTWKTKVRWFTTLSTPLPARSAKRKSRHARINSGNAACSFLEAYVHTE